MLYTLFLFSPILHIDLSVSTEEFEKKPEPLPEETAPIQKLDKLPVVSDSSILPLDIIDKTSDQTVNPTEADHATVQFVSDIDSVLSPHELKGKNPELISDIIEEEKQKEVKDVLPEVMKIYADTVVDEPTPQERKQIVDFTVLEDESKNVKFEKDIGTTDKDDESKVIEKENIIPVDENINDVDDMREKGEDDEKASEKDVVVSDTEDTDIHMAMKPNLKVDISSNETIMSDESIESEPEKNFTSVTVRVGEKPLERTVIDLDLTEIPTNNERDGLVDEDIDMSEKTSKGVGLDITLKHERKGLEKAGLEFDLNTVPSAFETEVSELEDERLNLDIITKNDYSKTPATSTAALNVKNIQKDKALPQKTRLDIETDVGKFDKDTEIYEKIDDKVDLNIAPEEVSAPADEQIIHVSEAIDGDGKTVTPMETINIITRMPKLDEAVVPLTTNKSELENKADIRIKSETMDIPEEEIQKRTPKVAPKWLPKVSEKEEPLPDKEMQHIYDEYLDEEQQPETSELEDSGTSVGIVLEDKPFISGMAAPINDNEDEVMPFKPTSVDIDVVPRDDLDVDQVAEDADKDLMAILKPQTEKSTLSLETFQMDALPQEKRSYVSKEIDGDLSMDIVPFNEHPHIQEGLREDVHVDLLKNDLAKSDKTEVDIDIIVPQPKKEYEISETLDEKVNLNIVPLDEDFQIHEKTDEKIEKELSQKMENIISSQTAIYIDIEFPALQKETETHESVDEKVNIGLLPTEEDLDVYETPGEIIEVDISSEDEATTEVVSEPFDKETKIEEIPDEIEDDTSHLPEMDFEVSAPAEEHIIFVSEAIDRDGTTLTPMETINIMTRMPKLDDAVVPIATYESELERRADKIKSETMDIPEEEIQKRTPKVAPKWLPKVSEKEELLPDKEMQHIYDEYVDEEQQPETTELEDSSTSVGIVLEDKSFISGMEAPINDNFHVAEDEVMPFKPMSVEIDVVPRDNLDVDQVAKDTDKELMAILKPQTEKSTLSFETIQMDALPQEKRLYVSKEIDGDLHMDIVPLNEHPHFQESLREVIHVDLLKNDLAKSDKTEVEIDIIVPQAKKEYEISETLDEKVNLNIVPLDEDFHIHEKTDEKIEIELSPKMENIISDQTAIDIDIELPALPKETETHESVDEKVNIGLLPSEEDLDVYETPGEIIEVDISSEDEATTEVVSEPFDKETKIEELPDEIEADNFDLPEMDFEVSAPAEEQLILVSEAIDREGKTLIPMETLEIIKGMPKKAETVIPVPTYESELVENAEIQLRSDTIDNLEEENMKPIPKFASKSIPNVSDMEDNIPAEEVQEIYNESVDGEQQPETTELEVQSGGIVPVDKTFTPEMEAPTQDSDLVSEVMPFTPGIIEIDMLPKDRVGVDENAENTNNEIMTIIKEGTFTSSVSLDTTQMDTPLQEKRTSISGEIGENLKMDIIPVDDNLNIQERVQESIQIDILQHDTSKSDKTEMDIDIMAPQAKKEHEITEALDEKFNLDIVPVNEDLHVHEKTDAKLEIELSTNTDNVRSDKMTTDMQIDFSALSKETEINESIDEKINIGLLPTDDDLDVYEMPGEIIEVDISSEDVTKSELTETSQVTNKGPAHEVKADEKINIDIPSVDELDDIVHSSGILTVDKTFALGMEAPKQDKDLVSEAEIMPFTPGIIEIGMLPKDNVGVDEVAENTDKEIMTIFKAGTDVSSLSLDNTQMDAPLQDKRTSISGEIGESMKMDIISVDDNLNIQERVQEAIQIDILQNDTTKSDTTEMNIDIIVPQPKKEYEISEKLDEKVNFSIVPLDEDFHIHEKTDEKIEIELSPKMENIISDQTAIDIDIELPALPKETETHESVDEKVNIGLLPSEEDLDVYETPGEIIEVDISSEDEATTEVVSEPFDKETKIEELPDEIEADTFDLPEMDFEVSAPAEEQLVLVSEAIDREGKTLIPMETLEIIKRMPKKAETVIPVPTYESELVENAEIQLRSDTIDNLEEENMKPIPKVASKSIPNVSDMEENIPAEEVQEVYNESVDGEQQPETTELEVQSVGIVPVDKTFKPEMEAPTQDSDLVSEVMPTTPGIIEIDMLPKDRVGVDENAENTNNEIMTIIKEGTVTSSVSLDTTQMDTPLQEKRTSISGEIGENLKMDIIPVDDNLNIQERVQESIQIDILQNDTTKSDKTEMDIDIIAPQAKKEHEITEALDEKSNLDIVPVNEDLHVHEKTDAKLEIELSTNMDNVRSDKMITDMQIDFSALSKETEINESIDEKINIGLLPTDDDLDVYEMPGEIIEVDISSEDVTKSELTETSQVTNKGPAHEVKADEKINIDIPSVDELDVIVHSSGILTVDKTFAPGMEAPKQDKDLVSEAEIMPFTLGIIEIDMLPKDNVGVDKVAENTDKEIMTIFKAGTDVSSLSLDNTQMDATLQDKRTSISGEIGESMKIDIIPVDDNLNIQERVQEAIQIDILQNDTTKSDTTEMDIDIIVPQPKKEYEISEKLDEKVNLNIVPLDEDFHIHEKTDEKIEIELSPKMENIISDQTAIDIDIELPALPKETETHESVDEKVNIGLLPSEEDLDVYETPGEIIEVDISLEDEATTEVVSEPFDKETKIEELPDEIEADNFDLPEMDFEVSAPAEEQLILVSEAIDREGKTLIPMETLEIIKRMPKKAETVIPVPTYESELVENADIQLRSDTIDNLEEENMKPIPKVASKSIPNVSDMEENIPAEEVQEIYNESVDGEQQPETTILEVQSVGIVPVDKTFTPEIEAPTQDSDLVSEVMPFTPGIIEIDMLPKDRVGVDENAENMNNEIMTIIKEGTVTSSVSLDTTQMESPLQEKRTSISGEIGENLKMDIIPVDDNLNIQERVQESIQIDILQNDTTKSDKTEMDIDIIAPQAKKEHEITEALDERSNLDIVPVNEDLHVHEKTDAKLEIELSTNMDNVRSDKMTTDMQIDFSALSKETEINESIDEKINIGLLPTDDELDVYEMPGEIIEVNISSEDVTKSELTETSQVTNKGPAHEVKADEKINIDIPSVDELDDIVHSSGILTVDKTFAPGMEAPKQDKDLVSEAEIMPFTPGTIEIDMLPKDNVDEVAENTDKEIMTIFKAGTDVSSLSLDNTQKDAPLQDKRTSVSGEIGESMKIDIISLDDNLNIQERVQEAIQIDILQNDTTKSDTTEMDIDIIVPQPKREYEISEKLDEKVNLNIVPLDEDFHIHEKTDEKIEIELSPKMENIISDQTAIDIDIELPALPKETETHESVDEKVNIGLLPSEEDLDVYETPGEIIEVDISSEDEATTEVVSEPFDKETKIEELPDEIEDDNFDLPEMDFEVSAPAEEQLILVSEAIDREGKTIIPMETLEIIKRMPKKAETVIPFPTYESELVENADIQLRSDTIDNLEEENMKPIPKVASKSIPNVSDMEENIPAEEVQEIFNESVDGEQQPETTILEVQSVGIVPVDKTFTPEIEAPTQDSDLVSEVMPFTPGIIEIDMLPKDRVGVDENAENTNNEIMTIIKEGTVTSSVSLDTTQMDTPLQEKRTSISGEIGENLKMDIIPVDDNLNIQERVQESIRIDILQNDTTKSDKTEMDIDIIAPQAKKEHEITEALDERSNLDIVPVNEDLHVHEKTDAKLEIELSTNMDNVTSDKMTTDMQIDFSALSKETEINESIDEKINIGLLPTDDDLDVYEMPGEIIEVNISSEDVTKSELTETSQVTNKGPAHEVKADEKINIDIPSVDELDDIVHSSGILTVDKTFAPGMEAPKQDKDLVSEAEIMPFTPGIIEIDMLPKDNVGVDEVAENTDKEIMTIFKAGTDVSSLSLDNTQMDAPLQDKRTSISGEIGESMKMDIIPVDDNLNIQERVQEAIQIDILQNDTTKSDTTEMNIDIIVPQPKKEYEIAEKLYEKVNLNIVPLDEDFHIHEKTDEIIEIELSPEMENIISDKTAIDIDIELPALPKETETHESVDEKVNIGLLPSEEDLDVYETPGEIIEVDISSEDEATTEVVSEPFDKETKIEELPDEIEADNFDLPEMDFEVSAPAEEQLILVSEAIDREGKTLIPMETLEIIKRMPKKAETVIPVPTYESELVENADIQLRSDTIDNLEEENMKPIPKVASKSIPNVSDMEENIPAEEVQELYNESVDGEQQPETTILEVQSGGIVPVDKTFKPEMEAPTQDSDLVSKVMPFTPGIIEIDMLPKDRVGVDENAENTNNEIMTIIKEGTVTSSVSLDTTQMDTPLQEKRTSISGEIGENLKMDIIPVDDNFNIQERVQKSIQIDILQNDTTKSDKTEMDIDIIAPQAKKEHEITEALDERSNLDIVPVNEDLHVHENTDAKLEIELSTNMDNVRSDKMTTDMQIDFSALSKETEINESIDEKINIGLLPTDDDLDVYEMPGEIIEVDISSEDVTKSELTETSQVTNKGPAHEVKADEKINIDIPSVDELDDIVHSSGILTVDKTFTPGMEAPKQDKDLVSEAEIMPFTPGTIEIDMLPKNNVGVDEVAENTDKEIMTIFKAGTDVSSLSLDNTQMDALLQDKRTSISGEIGESMKMDIIPVDDDLNIQERVQEAIQIDILQNDTTKSDTTEIDIDIIVPQPKKEYEILEKLDEKVNLNIVPLDENFHIHEKKDEIIEIELSPKMEMIISDQTAIDIDIELPALPKETETHESVDEKINIGLLPSEEDLDVYETPGEIIEVDISSEDEATTEVVSEPFDKETKIEELPDEIEADNFDLPEMDFEVSAPAEEQLILVSEAIDREGKTLIPMETLEIIKRMPKKAETVIPVPTYESEQVENADIQLRSDTIDNLEEENMKPIPKVASKSILNVSDMEENIPAEEVQELYNESVDGEQQPETTILEVQSGGIVPVDKTFKPEMEAPTQDSDLVSEVMPFTPGIIEIDMLPKDRVGVAENAENTNNKIMTIIKEGTVTSSVSLDKTQMDTPLQEKRTSISGEIGENLKMDIIPVDDNLNIQERVQESIQIDILQNDTTKSDKTEMDIDIIAPQAKKEHEITEALDERSNLDIVPVNEDLHVHEKTDAKLEIELSTNMDNVRSDKMTTDMQIDFSALSKETEINESIDEKINIGLLPTDDDLDVYEMPGEIIEVDISSEDVTKSELTETSQVTNKGPAHEVKADEKINIDIPSVDELDDIVHSSGILTVDKTFAPGMEAPKQDKDLVSEAEIMPFTPGTIEIDMLPKDNVGVDEVAENTDKEIMTIFKAGTDVSSLSLDNTQMDAPLQDKRTSISGEIGESMKMDIIPVDDNLNIQERVQESIQIDILQNDTTKSDTTEMDIDIIVPQPKKEYEISEKLDEKVNLNIVPLDEDFHIHEKTDEIIEIELSPKMENIISDQTAIDIDIELPALPKETETHESVDEKVNIGLLLSEEDLDVYETPGEIIEVDISLEDEATTEVVSEPFDKETKIEELPDEIEADNFDLPEMDFEVSAPAEEQLVLVSEAIDREGKTLIPMETLEIIKRMPKKAETVIPVPTYESELVENADIQLRSDTIDNLEEENMKPIPKVASKSIPNVSDMEENVPAEEVQELYNESVDGEQQPETTILEVQSVGIVPVDKTFTPEMEAPTQDSDLVSEVMPFTPSIIEIDMLPKDRVGVDENAENTNNEIMTIIKEGTVTSSVSLDTTQMDTPLQEKRTSISGEIGENLKMDKIPVDDNLNIQERVQESIQIDILQNDTTKSDKTEMDIDIIASQAKKEHEITEALDERSNLDIVPVNEDLHVHEKTDAKLEIELSTNMDNVRSDKMTTDMQIDFSALSKETEINESIDEKINIGLLPTDDDLDVYEMPGEIIEVDISSEDVTKSELTETSQVTNKGPAHEVKADEKINIDFPSVDELDDIVHSSGILTVDKTFALGMEAPKQDKDLVSEAEIMPFTPGIIEIDMLPKDNVGVDEVAENTDKEIMTIFKAGTDVSSLSLDNTQMDAPLQDKRTSISGEIGESMKMDIIPVDDNLNIQERVQEAIQIDILQNDTTKSDTTEMDIDIIVPQPKKEYEISEKLDEKVNLNIVPLDEDFHIHEKTDEKIEIELTPKMENIISDQTAIDIDIELPAFPKETETHESVDEKVNIGLLRSEEDLDVYETPGEIIEVDIFSEDEATTEVVSEPFDKETKIEELPDEIEADNFDLPEMDFEVSAPAEEQLILVSEAIDREGKTLIPMETLEIIKRMPKKAETVIPVPTYESELVENADIQLRSDTIDNLEEENMKPIPKVASKSIPNVSDMEENIPAEEVQEIYNESVDGEQQPETTELEVQSVGIVPMDKTFTPEMEAPTQDSDLVSEVMPFTPGIIEIDMLPKDRVGVDENAENMNNEIMTIIKEGTVTSSVSFDTTQMDTPLQEKRTSISGEIGENLKMDIIPVDDNLNIQERVQESIQIDILENDTTKSDKTEMDIDIIAPQAKKEHEITEALDEKFNLDIVPVNEDLHVHEKTDAKLEIELSTNMDNVRSDKMTTDMQIDFSALSKDTEISESIDEKFKIDMLPTDEDLDVYEMPGEIIEVDMSSGDDTKPDLRKVSQDIDSNPADEDTEDEKISLDITSKDSGRVNVDVSSTDEIDLIPKQQIGDLEKVNQDVEIDVSKPLTVLDIFCDVDEDVSFDLLLEMNHFEVSAPVEEQIVFVSEAIDSDGKTIIPMETIDITKRMPKMTETVIPFTTYKNELIDSADMQIKSDTMDILEEEQKKRTPKVASKSTPKVSEMEEILPDEEVQPIYDKSVDAEQQPVTTELDDNVHSSGILPVEKAFAPRTEAPTQDSDLASEAEVMPFTPGIIEIDMLPKNNDGVDEVAENTNRETMTIFRDGTDISSLSLDTTQMDTPLQEKRTSISGEIGENIKMDIIPLDDNLNIQEKVKEAIQIDILQNSVTDSDKTEVDIDIGMKAKKEYGISETLDEKFNLDITPQDEDLHIHEKTDEQIEIELSTNMDNVILGKGATDIEIEFPSLSKDTEMNEPIDENVNIGLLPTDKDIAESELPVDFITMDNSSEDDTKSEMRDIDQVIDRIPFHEVIADENINFDMTPVISDIVGTDGSETIVIDSTQKQPVGDLQQTNQDFEIDVRTSFNGLDIPDDVDETVNFDSLPDVDHFDVSAPAEQQLIYVSEAIDKDGQTIIPMEIIDITKRMPEMAEAVIPLAMYEKEPIDNADIQIKSDTMDILEESKQKQTPRVASKAIPKVSEMEVLIPDKEAQEIYNECVDGENQPEAFELEDIVQSAGILLVDKTFASEVDVLKIDEVISEYAEGTLIEDEILVIPREEEIEVLFRDYDIGSESDSDETDESLDSLDESLDSLESIEDDTYNIQYPEEEEVEEIRTTPIPAKDQTPFETITVITEEQDETYSETFEIQRTPNIHIEVMSKDTKPSADSELNSSTDKTSRIIPIEEKKADSVSEIIEIDIHEATDVGPKIVPEEKPYEKERIIPIKERIKTDGQEYFIEYPQEPYHDETEPHNVETVIKSEDKSEPELVKEFTRKEIDMMKEKLKNDRESHMTHDKVPKLISKEDVNLVVSTEERSLGTSVAVEEEVSVVEKHEFEEKEILNLQLKLPVMEEIKSDENALETEEYQLNKLVYEEPRDKLSESIPGDSAQIKHTKPNTVFVEQLSAEDLDAPVEVTTQDLSSLVQPHEVSYKAFEILEKEKSGTQCLKATGCVVQTHDLTLYESYCYLQLFDDTVTLHQI